jgi:hypothetical protein
VGARESMLAEMLPTWAIMSPVTGLESFLTLDSNLHRLVDAALDGHRIRSRSDRFYAFAVD